jgi:hypothetical protein
MATDLATLRQWLKQRVTAPEFREFLAESLLQMCRIDTIPTRNLADTCHREGQLLVLIEELIARHGLAGRLERSSISRTIAAHPFYTFPHYAGIADVYSGRSNLIYLRDAPPASGIDGRTADGGAGNGGMAYGGMAYSGVANSGVAVNAHIDTVAPYLIPRREGERVIGRGACDDKSGGAACSPPLRRVHLEADGLLQGYDTPGELFQAPQ